MNRDWVTGAEHEVAASVEDCSDDTGCEMYTAYRYGKPVAYRYGPSWVAMQLFMDGGYPTPEEALEAWARENQA